MRRPERVRSSGRIALVGRRFRHQLDARHREVDDRRGSRNRERRDEQDETAKDHLNIGELETGWGLGSSDRSHVRCGARLAKVDTDESLVGQPYVPR